ncbi:MAG: hypothetical protein KGP28_13155, partial [Bdellovibrionales bacterium]|nr:hypothetical protein [Bdellovibrionales bacterium]
MTKLLLCLISLGMNAHAATLPVAATDVAQSWDSIYWFLVYLSLIFFVGIVGAMVWFAFRYSKDKNKKPKYIHGHTGLEIIWTVIPTILLFICFGWGWSV